MKVLHASVMSEPAMGVLRQLEDEQAAASCLGLPWTSKLYCGEAIDSAVSVNDAVASSNRFLFKIAFYRWLRIEAEKADVIVLRHSFYDPIQLWFLLTARRPVYLVHHTLEVPELALNVGLVSKLKKYVEIVLGGLSLSITTGIIAVTPEILTYELGRKLKRSKALTYVYPNGIDFSNRIEKLVSGKIEHGNIELSSKNEDNKNVSSKTEKALRLEKTPIILFVSSVYAPWQGLEELVDAASKTETIFTCHIIGTLTDKQKELLKHDSRFVIHGLLSKSKIEQLSLAADIGLSALSLRKKNMKDACTLKVREYLASGLAVYAGYNDVFPSDFPFYKHGKIDIDVILDYAKDSESNNRTEVASLARPYIEKSQLLEGLYHFLLKQHG